jgi:hypothetical protein
MKNINQKGGEKKIETEEDSICMLPETYEMKWSDHAEDLLIKNQNPKEPYLDIERVDSLTKITDYIKDLKQEDFSGQ